MSEKDCARKRKRTLHYNIYNMIKVKKCLQTDNDPECVSMPYGIHYKRATNVV